MRQLRVLILEDNELDFELTQAELVQNLTEFQCELKWVTYQNDFLEALRLFLPDIVLSDYNLPQYNGLEALKDTQKFDPFLPFLFVTGELQEEKAAETIRSGAWEYVVKDRLFRLPIAIRTVLIIKEERIERKKVEEENHRLALVANSTTNTVKLCDAFGNITWVNPAFTKLTGYSLEDVKGRKAQTFLEGYFTEPSVIQFVVDKIQLGEGFKEMEFVLYTKSGQPYWVSAELQPVWNEKKEIIQFVIIESDITAKKTAELALEAREKRFRNLIEQSPLAIIEWGIDSHIVEWNPAAEKLYGYSRREADNKSFYGLFIPEENKDSAAKIWQDLLVAKQSYKHIAKTVNAAGKEIVCEWYNNPLLNEKGEVSGIVSMVEDITERRSAEENLRKKNEELTKINEELDKFVYSASHDLRAPVTSMLGLIEVAKMEKDPNEVFEYLNKQKKALKKMDEFIHEIVNYSRNGRMSVVKEAVDLQLLIEDIYDHYHYLEKAVLIEKTILVRSSLPFFTDKQRVSMALNNLISNSLKYADLNKRPPFLKIEVEITPEKAVIEVADNGEGIRPDLQSKIFDMFYRATQSSSGSGLGLYIVKEVVTKLGGEIYVNSEFGKGTQFKIVLPNG